MAPRDNSKHFDLGWRASPHIVNRNRFNRVKGTCDPLTGVRAAGLFKHHSRHRVNAALNKISCSIVIHRHGRYNAV